MFILLLLLWVILNGRITIEVLVIGAAVSALVYWFSCRHLGFGPKKELLVLRKLGYVLLYIAVLIIEAVKANIAVSRLVFARDINIKPRIIFFRSDLKSMLSKVVLSNSITLNPGTITLAIFDDVFCVHCLDKRMSEGITDSVFVRQLRNMEREKPVKEQEND